MDKSVAMLAEPGHVYTHHVLRDDCGVRAIVNASGLPYDEVVSRIRAARLFVRSDPKHGAATFTCHIPAIIAEFFGPVEAAYVAPCVRGRPRGHRTLRGWLSFLQSGTFIVRTGGVNGHMFAVRDGVALDWIAGTAQRRLVSHIWRLW